MAPKVNTNPTKLAACLKYFHTSGVAHSIKDLEKALPSVASINGMQVKDYLQALSDENQIRVEKIGSGNWYWSFPGEEKRAKTVQLTKAIEERDKIKMAVKDLNEKIKKTEIAAAKDGNGQEQQSASWRKQELEKEINGMRSELERFKDTDPVEIERKRLRVQELKHSIEAESDKISEIERYMRESMGMDKGTMIRMKMEIYGQEYSEEDEGLKEWIW